MDKLTLEHLAPYLPYQLKMYHKESAVKIQTMTFMDLSDGLLQHHNKWRNKPILRPLSELNGSDLMKHWNKEHSIEIRYNKRVLLDVNSSTCIDIIGYPLAFITDLFKNHFDVFGLIEKGLAISTDTLGKEVKGE
ncbi:hypothetical protein D3C87_447620 [compost metagenome]